jgi:uncharacterized protein (DUF433 family)
LILRGGITVTLVLQAETPPLREDSSGAIRVGNSRVLLELVLEAFQDGATPEAIVQRYDTLALEDVYAVIGYYLRHRSECDRYLAACEKSSEEMKQRWDECNGDLSDIRARLMARRALKKKS